MIHLTALFLVLFLLSSCHAYTIPSSKKCTSSDTCWPSPSVWSAFNATISGRLINTHPSASICHNPLFSAPLCSVAKQNWTSSFWRTDQPGAYTALLWEHGPASSSQCLITSPRSAPCPQGFVSPLTVNATTTAHIATTIKFARKHNLALTVKNTGHDHLGRSSRRGSLSIWTHHMRGRVWYDDFTPTGAPAATSGVPAVALAAGEQWLNVYRDAATRGRIVAGGSARTVGAAGGYLTGGGHGIFAHAYGLAVDNLLQATLITPSGEVKVLNSYSSGNDAEYFWALRGGGGCAFGVIVEAVYRTHPDVSNVQVVLAQFNATASHGMREVLTQTLPLIPDIAIKHGYTGYSSLDGGFAGIFIRPNGTAAEYQTAFAPLRKLAEEFGNTTARVAMIDFPSWIRYTDAFLTDPNIATNVVDSSRLLHARDVAPGSPELKKLVGLILKHTGVDNATQTSAGFNFIGAVNNSHRHLTAVHPSWIGSWGVFSLGVDWKENASVVEKRMWHKRAVEASVGLEKVVGRERGTYVNEASPWEPRWREVFWGKEKYGRLERVKRRIDKEGVLACNRCVGAEVVYEP